MTSSDVKITSTAGLGAGVDVGVDVGVAVAVSSFAKLFAMLKSRTSTVIRMMPQRLISAVFGVADDNGGCDGGGEESFVALVAGGVTFSVGKGKDASSNSGRHSAVKSLSVTVAVVDFSV